MWNTWILCLALPVLSWAATNTTEETPFVVVNEIVNPPFTYLTSGNWEGDIDKTDPVDIFLLLGTDMDAVNTSIISHRFTTPDITVTFFGGHTEELNVSVLVDGLDPETKHRYWCFIEWGDEMWTVFFPANATTLRYTYADIGVYRPSVTCQGDGVPTIIVPDQDTEQLETTTYFGEQYKNRNSPMVFIHTESIVIQAAVNLNNNVTEQPTMHWRLLRIINSTTIEPVYNISQPRSITLLLPPEYLEPGNYIVIFEVYVNAKNVTEGGDSDSDFWGKKKKKKKKKITEIPASWADDFIYIKIALPDLSAIMEGGDFRSIPLGQIHYVNGSRSADPVQETESVLSQPMSINWVIGIVENITIARMQPFFTDPYSGTVKVTRYRVDPGSAPILEIDTSIFPVNTTWLVAMVTVERGGRRTMSVQFLKLVPNSLPFSIKCVFNCNTNRDRKFIYERIELDSVFDDPTIVTTGFSYLWSVDIVTTSGNCSVFSAPLIAPPTGYRQPSFKLLEGSLKEGCNYEIRLDISSSRYGESFNSFIRNAGIRPYGGNCTITPTSGIATMDMFTVQCMNWHGLDYRVKNSSRDISGLLTYKATQIVTGAVVPEEPIIETRSTLFDIVLKVGNPARGYVNQVKIEILDVNKNTAKIYLSVTVNPYFDVTSIQPTESSVDVINDFADEYILKQTQLYLVANIDLLLPLAISACSHIHLIKLPLPKPPVPAKLNKEGFIMDLNENGNKDIGNLESAVDDAQDTKVDPATLAIHAFLENLAEFVANLTNDYIVTSGSRKYDPMTKSLLTNVLTNIAGKEQYMSTGTKVSVINLGEVIGISSLEDIIFSPTADMAGELENAANEVTDMYHTISDSTVPDDLKDNRPVVNLLSGRRQVAAMLSASSDKFDLDSSSFTAEERAFLYVKMQLDLRYRTNKKKKESNAAARMIRKLMKSVQNNVKLCDRCDNKNNTRSKQMVAKNTASDVGSQNYSMPTSSFHLGDLNTSREGVAVEETSTTSVSATELTKNVFMYDNDGKSSFVSSKILHIDVQTEDTYITPGFVTFDMTVITPVLVTTTPLVDPDDVSELSLHRFLYQSYDDTVCFITNPVTYGGIVVDKYTVYIKFDGSPTIFDYDVLVTIKPDSEWRTCVPPELMLEHSGLTYLGIHVPGIVKEVNYTFALITVACMVWDEIESKWHTNKCELEWFPDQDKIRCFCRNLTEMTFGNSFYVPPNTIDFNSVFLKFSPHEQAAVIGTLSGIFVIFILAALLLSRMDKFDVLKWSVTPLLDNRLGSEHFYLVQVYTGMRRSAGTRSHVGINLTGHLWHTGIRHLYDGIREEFSTGSVVTFLMTTKETLGHLQHLYIWHDNTGEGDFGPWYLDHVTVYDVTTRLTTNFVAEKWLSVETSCDATLTAVPQDSKLEFETRFFSQARQQLSDNHMWMSILYRPQSSIFTRVQRAACALCFILLSMIANAMFFNPESDYESPPLFQVGPFRFTSTQIYVSIICAVITTPVVMFLVFLFKHTRPSSLTPRKIKVKPRETVTESKWPPPTNSNRLSEPKFSSSGSKWPPPIYSYSNDDESDPSGGSSWPPPPRDFSWKTLTSDQRSSDNRSVHWPPRPPLCPEDRCNTCGGHLPDKTKSSRCSSLCQRLRSWCCCCWSRKKKPDVCLCNHERDKAKLLKEYNLSAGVPMTVSGFSLPHGFIYLAWLIVAGCVVTCSFFIMLYSMEWGKQKSEEWLSSICMSILESMIVIDPIMVLCMSVLLAFIVHKTAASLQFDVDAIVAKYKSRIRSNALDECYEMLMRIKWEQDTSTSLGPPPTGRHLKEATTKSKVQFNTNSLMWNLMLNLWFLLLVLGICHSNRDPHSYDYQQHVIEQVVKPNTNAKFVDGPKFMNIKSRGDFFTWLDKSAIPNLFPEKDINGVPLHWSYRLYTEGIINFRMGPPRLRQLRIHKETCNIPYFGDHDCYEEYTITDETTEDLCIGWTRQPCSQIMFIYNVSLPAWSFTSALDIWGIPISGIYNTYGGGGYIATLDISRNVSLRYIDELFWQMWLDRKSRAVLLEFTLYNPATELFVYCEFMVEFPETGAAIPTYKLYPIRPNPPSGPIGNFVIFLEVMFIVHVIAQIVKLAIRFYQLRWRMFLKFWMSYDFVLCLICLVAIVLFGFRYYFANATIAEYRKDSKQFVNFAHIVLWDSAFMTAGAVLVFMGILRILEIFKSSKKINAVVKVLSHCRGDLFQYSIFFAITLIAFALLGTALFGDNLGEYRNVYRSLTTLFLSLLGKHRYSEMEEGYPVLAKVFFIMYTICVVFFTLTIFLCILGTSVDVVVQDMRHDDTEDILDHLVKQVKMILFKPQNKSTPRIHCPLYTGEEVGRAFAR